MTENRGERRARTKKVIKSRLKNGKGLIFGLDPDKKREPHRLAKHKPKFTRDRGSLKEEKQAVNRAARRKVREAARTLFEKEIEPFVPNVRWDYW